MFGAFQLLIKRLSIAMLIASLCRLLFLALNPIFFQYSLVQLFECFWYGLLYDLSVTMYVHGLLIAVHLLPRFMFYTKEIQKFTFSIFLIGQLIIVFFNLMDIGYFPISGKRSGMEIFSMAAETDGLVIKYLVDFWYLLLALIFLLWLSFKLYNQTYVKALANKEWDKWNSGIREIGLRFAIIAITFVGARGGLNLLPLNTFDAARQTQAELIPLVVNTPFNMIISTQQSGLSELNYLSVQTEEKWFMPKQKMAVGKSKPNVVLIIVESLGKEYVGFYNNKKGYTPFLDSLMQFSEVYTHAYANGKKSIEGIPAIMASMPSWMEQPYLSSFYQGNSLQGIGYYLSKNGYDVGFYHGGKNGTMSFDNFIALSGGGKYFGKNEYPNQEDYDGYWGISDRPYLQYFGRKLSEKKGPFFAAVFTLTSHHPYQLPKNEIGKFPKGTLPIHQTIGYTDDALRDFFAYARTQEWYANTTFIVTADHSAENETRYYQSPQGRFEAPLVIFRSKDKKLKINERTVSHVDIMPMVLFETNYPDSFFSFGVNPTICQGLGGAIQYNDMYYRLVQWPYIYHFDGVRGISLFNMEQDSFMKRSLLGLPHLQPKVDSMDFILKSMLQSYHRNLIYNKSYIDRKLKN
jgi:phosphoglycerol transferase MdoB-like AlkP superfamily enzyme